MSDQPARAVKYETVDIRAFLQDLAGPHHKKIGPAIGCPGGFELDAGRGKVMPRSPQVDTRHAGCDPRQKSCDFRVALICGSRNLQRSEEHTSELQSLMRISYAVFCLKKKKK